MQVVKTTDNVNKVLQQIDALTRLEVLVGIPAETTGRNDGKMTNAGIAYAHEFGSPARNLPARPFLRPGVKNAKDDIGKAMLKGAKTVLDGKTDAALKTLNTVGMIARNSVVKAITNPSPPFVPLKPATIRARLMRTQGGRRKLKKIMAGGKQLGMSSPEILSSYAQASWDTGKSGNLNIMPLLDTLQMRNAITYVIRQAAKQRYGNKWGIQLDYGKVVTK